MQFEFPELFLLLIPLGFAFHRWGAYRGVTGWIRLLLAVLIVFALTGPQMNLSGKGLDVVVIVDRSKSMPAHAAENILELVKNLQQNRGAGDRVGLVTFGLRARVEQTLSEQTDFSEFTQQVLADGSDLNDALHTALNLVNPNRPARILVFSDGEYNGADPYSAARRAYEAKIPIDYREFPRQSVGDLAVESVLLPDTAAPQEPFQFQVWIHADREATGTVTVSRNQKVISQSERQFHVGMNRLILRDILPAGFHGYRVALEVENDPIAENNVGQGVVRVESGPRVLVLNTDGVNGRLSQALQSARIPVDVVKAQDHPLTQDSLDAYRAVVVENVPASQLGRMKMSRLAQFVEDLGGGLMLTGGERSFGTGGYFCSPLDDVLPVSMELREEHRRDRLALAVALDRSGSMSVPVTGSKTKMDLANLGTAECIRLLSAGDSVAVIAVDSSPHVIQPMTLLEDPESIVSKTLRIESMGGGIFVYEALVAAGNELMKAESYSTRHIILFADAADSENPADYKKLLQQYRDAGISVSVIGLGRPTDSDADLLRDIATLGKGNVMFTDDPQELPRLFSQDTMSVARNTFIKPDPKTQPQGISGRQLPDFRLLGEQQSQSFPHIGGYNLSYLKPQATMGVVSLDEYQAPWSAFWYRGLGRVAALTFEVDGPNTGAFSSWPAASDFLVTHLRWLLGSPPPDQAFVDIQRDGQDAVVTVELDPNRADRQSQPELIVVPPGVEREATFQPDFVWIDAHTLQSRFPLDRLGTYRTLLKTAKQQFQRGPALTLPYSPEFVPRIGLPEGSQTLSNLAELSGGERRTDVLEIFQDPPRSASMLPLLPWLVIAGLLLLITEIAGRRLSLWERWEEAELSIPEVARQPARRRLALPRLRLAKWRRKAGTVDQSVSVEKHQAEQSPQSGSPEVPQTTVSELLEQAKRKAKRRLD